MLEENALPRSRMLATWLHYKKRLASASVLGHRFESINASHEKFNGFLIAEERFGTIKSSGLINYSKQKPILSIVESQTPIF